MPMAPRIGALSSSFMRQLLSTAQKIARSCTLEIKYRNSAFPRLCNFHRPNYRSDDDDRTKVYVRAQMFSVAQPTTI